MRRIAVALSLVALLSLVACSEPSSEEPSDGPGKIKAGPGNWVAELPESVKLRGQAIEESESGPWTIRKTASPSNSGGKDGSWGGPGSPPAPGGVAFEGDDAEMEGGAGVPSTGGPSESRSIGIGGGGSGGKAVPSADMDPGMDPTDSPRRRGDAGGGAPAQSAPLKAAATDDNEDYEKFLSFLAEWGDKEGAPGNYQLIDVADRRFIRIVNEAGNPVPGAVVKVVDETADRVVLYATTYGDGRVPFYPHVADAPNASIPVVYSPGGDLIVEASRGEARERVRWDGSDDELVVKLGVPKPIAEPLKLDVLLLIDTTGSMGEEIGAIKASLLGMTGKLRSLTREFDLRYAAVLFRDLGDAYVTKAHPFTGDIEAFDSALKEIQANGGGDGPESVNQGLAEAVGRADWRDGAAKVMFLIGDAAPHMDYDGDIPYGESLQAALAQGIRIHSVAANGLVDYPAGSLVFRQIAQFTRGKFIFIQYGTMAASAASHGVTGKTKSNNLDDILFEQIQVEIATWGR